MKLLINELEKKLDKKIKRNIQSIGLDIAERTGVCIITANNKNVNFDWHFIQFDKSNIEKVYKEMYFHFKKVINKNKIKDNVVIIEDTFLQRFGRLVQADVFKKLTRFGTLALATCYNKDMPYYFILAKSARAKLKIKMITGKPKESVAKYLKKTLDIETNDNDISDSIVLALLGIIEDLDFRSNAQILKEKKKLNKNKMSLCSHCGCMTKTLRGKCSKCKGSKK